MVLLKYAYKKIENCIPLNYLIHGFTFTQENKENWNFTHKNENSVITDQTKQKYLFAQTEYKNSFQQVIEVDIHDADDKMNDIAIAKHDGSKDWNHVLYWNYVIQQGAVQQVYIKLLLYFMNCLKVLEMATTS